MSRPSETRRISTLSPAARKHGATRVAFSLIVLLILAASAQPQMQTPGAAALTGPYRIAGTVVNEVTGTPVHGATVSVLTTEDNLTFASTETDGDGHFALERLPAGKFELTASKRGYVTSLYDEHEGYDSAIVTGADQETGSLVFKLAPGAVLSGVVTGDGGDAVAGAEVMLFRKPAGHGPDAVIQQAGTETTDDTGAYEFTGLEAGEYWIAVSAQPWYAVRRGPRDFMQNRLETPQQAALDVAYPVTYFDSTTEEASATPIELTSASRQEANISLHAVPTLHMTLPLPIGPQGQTGPAPTVQQMIFDRPLQVEDGQEMVVEAGMVGVQGLAPGEYEIQQGSPPRTQQVNLGASQQFDPDAGAPAMAVKGQVEDTHGAPVAEGNLLLEPAEGTVGARVVSGIARGAFSFPAVAPGTWRLRALDASQKQELPVTSIAVDGRVLAGNRVVVADHPLSLVVTASTHAARVEGFARRDGKGVAGVMVVLVPKDPAAMPSLVRRDESDSDGSFGLRDVAPGAYTVVAIADGWDVDWSDPRAMARYLPGGVSVTVKDEGNNAPAGQAPQRIALAEAVPVQAK